MNPRFLIGAVAAALTFPVPSGFCVGNFDWPQWQGPDRTAHSQETGLLPALAMTVAGVAAADGKLLWRYDKPANSMRINISTPIYHDGQVFAATAYDAGGGSARLVKKDSGELAAEEVWFSKSMENHHGGVILHDGALFGANGGDGGGYLAGLDFKTGEGFWNERDADKRRVTKGSVALADGRIYYRTEEGPMVLIEPSRKGYLERGRFTQPERTDKPAWAHPVGANGRLYIRDQGTLFCYDVKALIK